MDSKQLLTYFDWNCTVKSTLR